MKVSLPKQIKNDIIRGETSLGENPAFPPNIEENFVLQIIKNFYENRVEDYLKKTDSPIDSGMLSKELVKCMKVEKNNVEALERLCGKVIKEMFRIPNDTVRISIKIKDKIDTKSERLVPETIVDYTFKDINDMKKLSLEIYKRRILNSLVYGAASYYSMQMKYYINELFDIDEELPKIYKTIFLLNNILIYSDKIEKATNGGRVDVNLSTNNGVCDIKAEGLIFPVALEETIRGILELSISHGLPHDMKRAMLITGKSDFKMAELWDQRLGLPLWIQINGLIKELGQNPLNIGLNFLFMEISKLPVKKFNAFIREVLAQTEEGYRLMAEMINMITHNKKKDDFDDYMSSQENSKIQMNDNFTPNELMDGSLCDSIVKDYC